MLAEKFMAKLNSDFLKCRKEIHYSKFIIGSYSLQTQLLKVIEYK